MSPAAGCEYGRRYSWYASLQACRLFCAMSNVWQTLHNCASLVAGFAMHCGTALLVNFDAMLHCDSVRVETMKWILACEQA